jgi:cytoskeleton protein RodZ
LPAQELAVSSFGEGFKRERDKKKITLDQVAVSTKISVRMLRAIEDEKFDQLPGGIFNKSFVRTYARHLGLDEEKAVADYLAASAPEVQVQPEGLELRAMAEQKEKERQRQARLKKDFPWGSIAVVLLLTALGFSIWGVLSGRETLSRRSNPIANAAQPSAMPATTAAESVQQASAAPAPAQVPKLDTTATSSSVKPQLSSELKGNTSEDDNEMEVTTRHFSQDATGRTVLTPAAKTGNFSLLVTARENSWLSITADGQPVFTGTLIAPGVQLVHATNSVVLRAGNLGGLDIDFNGKRLPTQGVSGEAKTLTFSGDGLEGAKAPAAMQTKSSIPVESPKNSQ